MSVVDIFWKNKLLFWSRPLLSVWAAGSGGLIQGVRGCSSTADLWLTEKTMSKECSAPDVNLSGSWVGRDKLLMGNALSPTACAIIQVSPVSQLSFWDASNPRSVTFFVLHLSSGFELLFILYCPLLSLKPGYDFFSVSSPCPLFLLVCSFFGCEYSRCL